MFKRSERKIVAAIMTILTLLWVVTLAVILFASYSEVSSTNREMLEEHVAMYTLEDKGGTMIPGKPMPGQIGPHADTNRFKLSTFYSVALTYEGEILAVENDEAAIYDSEELQEMALAVFARDDDSGTYRSLAYYKADKGGYILVAFMDNTIIRESMTTIFRYTVIIGGAAIVALFFLAVFLAKRIVRPLEESYQKQKQFISDAGHELKTPVSVVNANADLLAREIGDNPWLSNIQYENERMGQLVGQLLELARTENVKVPTEPLDLSRLVAGGALPFESVAYERGLLLNTQIPDGVFVLGNGTQLSQLVSILIDNAIRHSRGGKEIFVKLSDSRTHAVISVVNAGDPIPPEQAEHLFERFYRVDEARSADGQHYGLGLAIAKAIVTSHHGKIEVRCHQGLVEFRATIAKA